MSVLTRSTPPRRAQGLLLALSVVFGALAIASGYTATTNSLTGFDFWVAFASLVAIEVGALVGVGMAVRHLVGGRFAAAAVAALIGAICAGNALANGLTFAWSKHVAQEAQRGDKVTTFTGDRSAAKARVAVLESQLVLYDKVRSGAAIEGDLRACEAKDCRKKRVDALRAEQVKAGERDGIARALVQAKAERDAVSAPPPAGTPLALFLDKLMKAPADMVELGAALLYVSLLQCVGPLFAALSGFGVPTTESDVSRVSKQPLLESVHQDGAYTERDTQENAQRDAEGDTESEPPKDSDEDSPGPGGCAERRAIQRLVSHINESVRASGGELLVTHRGLSRTHAVSTGTVGKALARVAQDGVTVIPSPRGTRLVARAMA